MLIRTLAHRETDPDVLAYLINTYLEDLLEIACGTHRNKEVEKKDHSGVDHD
jgi:hypothetical protein